MATGSDGSIYLAGNTSTVDYPTTPGAYQTISLTPAGIIVDASTIVLTCLGVVQLTIGGNTVTIGPNGVNIASAGQLNLTGAAGVNITSPATVTITGSLVAIN